MSATVRNTDTMPRVWPTLNRANGSVLALEPGEQADVPDGTAGPFLATVAANVPLVVASAAQPKTEKTLSTDTGGK